VRSRYLNWVDGRLAQMVIASDITPRRHAEEQSAAQAERAQSASRLITMGEMASSVAHELNQPLTAINNYCNGMISRIKRQADPRRRPADRAGEDRAPGTARRADHPAHPLIREAQRAQPHAVGRGSMVARRSSWPRSNCAGAMCGCPTMWPRACPGCMVDPILIEQVLVNLLKNAAESIDHAHRPTARRSVELRVVPKQVDSQNVVEFSVLDSGQGLAPEVMDRLYEAFFSTKVEGMGIGLNLCRTIVESHQGRMQAENIYNGPEVTGCRFSFWIPVSDATNSIASPMSKDAGVSA
jgi:C4-dicarboxylate-specific signal transduction histidine kinase